jgi:hyaluronoglucosaminidase
MIRKLRLLVTLAAVAMVSLATTTAQDLSSQRGEKQDVGVMLGHKVDHGGLIINPTPQPIYTLRSLPLDITNGVVLKGDAKAYAEDIDFSTVTIKAETGETMVETHTKAIKRPTPFSLP